MVFPLILLLFLAFSLHASQPVIAAYYDHRAAFRQAEQGRTVFSLNKIPPNLLTDLYFAFVPFNSAFQFIASDEDAASFKAMQELQDQSKGLNLFMSLGGWGFNDPYEGATTYQLFSYLVSSQELRAKFIQQVAAFAKANRFNGIDFDWEYPGDLTRGGQEQDFDNFLLLLKEFQVQEPHLLLSAAFPAATPRGLPKSFHDNPDAFYTWIKACSPYLDRIQLMAYDYHTPNDVPKMTGVNAPLSRDTNPNSYLYIVHSLKTYLEHGIPKEKIVLGIPLFGHSYAGVQDLTEGSYFPGKPFQEASLPGISTKTPGLLSYYEIADLIAGKQFQFATDPLTSTAIAYSPQKKAWISFDTPETIKLKAELARTTGLKGIFFWSIDQDEYQWNPLFPCITSGKSSLGPFP